MYKINHPNIVKLYGHFEDNTYCYLIMEYMSGGDTYSLLMKYGDKKINNKIIVSILKDIISATYYLHHMNPPIIHRDIKSENILFNSQMRAKLTDFGWSNYLKKNHMKRMTYAGTPVYLAPELVNNLAVDLIKKTLRYNPEERISLRNMLMHPFFTKYYPDAVNSLIRPDGKRPKICIISKDNPQIDFFSIDYINNNINTNTNFNFSSINNNNNNYFTKIPYNYTPKNKNQIISKVQITAPSYPKPILKQSYYIPSFDNYSGIINSSISTFGYSTPLNSLQIQELVDNQKRIDELVVKPEKKEIKKRNHVLRNYYTNNNFNVFNKTEIYKPSSSNIYRNKNESTLLYSFNGYNNLTFNRNIKYSLPLKYDIKPVKYNKPKIIYSSMTTKRKFEGNPYEYRLLNNLFGKYGMIMN